VFCGLCSYPGFYYTSSLSIWLSELAGGMNEISDTTLVLLCDVMSEIIRRFPHKITLGRRGIMLCSEHGVRLAEQKMNRNSLSIIWGGWILDQHKTKFREVEQSYISYHAEKRW
jgi:hypothetical protein